MRKLLKCMKAPAIIKKTFKRLQSKYFLRCLNLAILEMVCFVSILILQFCKDFTAVKKPILALESNLTFSEKKRFWKWHILRDTGICFFERLPRCCLVQERQETTFCFTDVLRRLTHASDEAFTILAICSPGSVKSAKATNG